MIFRKVNADLRRKIGAATAGAVGLSRRSPSEGPALIVRQREGASNQTRGAWK